MPERSTEPLSAETTFAEHEEDTGAGRSDEAVDALAFLDVTESTQRLLAALELLHLEAENYRNAAASLDRSNEATMAVVAAVREVAEGTGQALDALRDSGIPEVIARLEKSESAMTNLTRTLGEQSASLASIGDLNVAMRDQLAQLAKQQMELVETAAAIRKEADAGATKTEGTLTALGTTLDQHGGSLASIHESIGVARDQLGQLARQQEGFHETTLAIREEMVAQKTIREEQHQRLNTRVAAATKTVQYTLGVASLAAVGAIVGLIVALVR